MSLEIVSFYKAFSLFPPALEGVKIISSPADLNCHMEGLQIYLSRECDRHLEKPLHWIKSVRYYERRKCRDSVMSSATFDRNIKTQFAKDPQICIFALRNRNKNNFNLVLRKRRAGKIRAVRSAKEICGGLEKND